MSTHTTTQELLDKAAAATGSDYKTAKALGITPQRLSDWRHGRQNPQPEDKALLASLAGDDPTQALVRAILEKHADTPRGERLRTALGKALRRTGELAITLSFASIAFFGHDDAEAVTHKGVEEGPTTMFGMLKTRMFKHRKTSLKKLKFA
jgi:transcriptional regulator with XRE-family HTH domain